MTLASSSLHRRTAGSGRLRRYGGILVAGVLGLGMLQAAPAQATAMNLSVKDIRTTEIDAGLSTAVVRVVLSETATRRVTARYTTVDGIAKATTDYVAQSGTVVIPRGGRVGRIVVGVRGDLLDERVEPFRVRISQPTGAMIADRVGLVRIVDNDPLPRIIAGDVTIEETDAGATVARFPVSLSEVSGRAVRVTYSVGAGTANEDTDFVVSEPTGVVEFPAGASTRSVGFVVLGDVLEEADETVYLTLSDPVNVSLPDGTAVATIRDNDELSLFIDDVTVIEGAAATFTVHLSRATNQTVNFNYATSNVSASSSSDYTAASGSRSIVAGATSTTISVPTVNDALVEDTETFHVTLSSAVNAGIKDAVGVGTITDNDGPSLRVGDVTVIEGSVAYVPVTLSTPMTKDVTFSWSTASGTAATSDYSAASGTGTIKARSVSATIAVSIRQDTTIEADEVFYVNIFNPANAVVADAQGMVTIDDDDGPTLTIGDVDVDEGGNAYFYASLSAPAPQTVSFDWTTANGTALSTSDYKPAGGDNQLIVAGQTRVRLTVETTEDALDEFDEYFAVNLSDVRNAQIGDAQAVGTIVDDDPLPTVTFGSTTADADEGQDVVLTVKLSVPSSRPVTVEWSTANGPTGGGAIGEADYVVVAGGTVTIAAGATTGTITVKTVDDPLDEADEIFYVTLNKATNAALVTGQSQATVTILDDDPK